MSAALMTCWYHSGKSSERVGEIAFLGCFAIGGVKRKMVRDGSVKLCIMYA